MKKKTTAKSSAQIKTTMDKAEKSKGAKKKQVKKPENIMTSKGSVMIDKLGNEFIPDEEGRVFISQADQYLFAQGTHYQIYKKLGAHISVQDGVEGVFFAVWAPNAAQVHVVGSFNGWNEDSHPMDKLGEGGIYSTFVAGIGAGEIYKFLITTKKGDKLYKADPFANYAELRPETASIVTDIRDMKWSDAAWISERSKKDYNKEPVAIYECHIGSWRRHPGRENEGFYNYREFADAMVDYIKKMNYTHVELIGLSEHPFDGSWGYQVTGYYAPTSRYGTPQDFQYMVNKFHKNKIGVIIDWVPAHFPRDAHGLADFDGQPLFEHPDPRMGEHPDWGTKIFNYSKTEVKNFLIANVLFWINEFHIDGIRVDAVASMLYLDYGKQDGQWCPNKYGGNENLDAIEFFKHLNSVVRGAHPGVMTIAEESTAWPKITGDINDNGLYFSFKWNMGWMHDFCEYMKLDPFFRKGAHNCMTFAMSYNSSENYILPLSHDEVVHLKCSMVEKMPGYKKDKYANLRTGYTFMFGHEGKKLLFMGQEFGQEREWSEERELDWYLLGESELNQGMQDYVAELLSIYNKYPAMHEIDNSWDGFDWVKANDDENSTYAFIRKSKTDKKKLLFVMNMTPMERENYRVGVPEDKKYSLILNSDDKSFGGDGGVIPASIKAEKEPWDGMDYSISFDLPPYASAVFVF